MADACAIGEASVPVDLVLVGVKEAQVDVALAVHEVGVDVDGVAHPDLDGVPVIVTRTGCEITGGAG